MSSIAELKERVLIAESAADYYKSLVDSFFSGQPEDGGGMNHIIMAQWGRKRLEEKKRSAVLLGGQGT